MSTVFRSALILLLVALVAAVAWGQGTPGSHAPTISTAPPLAPDASLKAVSPDLRDHACRVFPLDLNDGQGAYFETSDRTGPIGDWLVPLEGSGWEVEQLDFETSQTVSGFPAAHVMVCVARLHGG